MTHLLNLIYVGFGLLAFLTLWYSLTARPKKKQRARLPIPPRPRSQPRSSSTQPHRLPEQQKPPVIRSQSDTVAAPIPSPTDDFLNPLNPLSPLSPLNPLNPLNQVLSEPVQHHSSSYDASPSHHHHHHDPGPAPSHDPSPSHSSFDHSSSSSYDSGSGGGGGSDGGSF